MFGFLNVNKPVGITSHDVISRLRRVLKIKQIGHAGTLDPMASGVLPIAVSGATKLLDYLPSEKEYVADFKLGYISASYDTEVELEKYSDKVCTCGDINNILPSFCGEIRQKPPIYSAIKVGGKKLYEFARAGETAEIPERTIFVSKIELLKFDEASQTGKILVNCSKGTYIRSIIHDIGQKLGTGAVMSGLERVLSGGMTVVNSMSLTDDITVQDVENNLISPEKIIPFEKIEITDAEYQKVKNGNSITKDIKDGHKYILYKSEIIAFAESSEKVVKIKKVFLQ